MRAFFCGPWWDFVFPPRSPITGEVCPDGLDCAHTLVWTFSFVVPGGTSYFEAWWAVYYTTMPLPLF